MDQSLDERQRAIESCSCPREAGEILSAPKCAAFELIGDVMFVKGNQFTCEHFFSFGEGHVCNCANRIALYKTYKI